MKYLKRFNENIEDREKASQEALNEFKSKLDATNDLVEVDEIADELEGTMRGLLPKDYEKFHRNLVPSWVQEHWGKDMTFNGNNLFELLYDHYHPMFEKYLNENGYESQECFVAYEASHHTGEGIFKMGFDVWKEDDAGWACFLFNVGTFGKAPINNFNLVDNYKETRHEQRPEEATVVIEMGKGTFYRFETERPYKGLAEYFGDGGYILRLD